MFKTKSFKDKGYFQTDIELIAALLNQVIKPHLSSAQFDIITDTISARYEWDTFDKSKAMAYALRHAVYQDERIAAALARIIWNGSVLALRRSMHTQKIRPATIDGACQNIDKVEEFSS